MILQGKAQCNTGHKFNVVEVEVKIMLEMS